MNACTEACMHNFENTLITNIHAYTCLDMSIYVCDCTTPLLVHAYQHMCLCDSTCLRVMCNVCVVCSCEFAIYMKVQLETQNHTAQIANPFK